MCWAAEFARGRCSRTRPYAYFWFMSRVDLRSEAPQYKPDAQAIEFKYKPDAQASEFFDAQKRTRLRVGFVLGETIVHFSAGKRTATRCTIFTVISFARTRTYKMMAGLNSSQYFNSKSKTLRHHDRPSGSFPAKTHWTSTTPRQADSRFAVGSHA